MARQDLLALEITLHGAGHLAIGIRLDVAHFFTRHGHAQGLAQHLVSVLGVRGHVIGSAHNVFWQLLNQLVQARLQLFDIIQAHCHIIFVAHGSAALHGANDLPGVVLKIAVDHHVLATQGVFDFGSVQPLRGLVGQLAALALLVGVLLAGCNVRIQNGIHAGLVGWGALFQDDDVGDHLCAGVLLESVVGQANGRHQVGIPGQRNTRLLVLPVHQVA